MRKVTLGLPFLALATLSCAHRAAAPPQAPAASLSARGVPADPLPAAKGARLVPEAVDEEKVYGVEPGGGVRTVVAGYRVVTLPTGAILASEGRLPSVPGQNQIRELPARLGGGFLFQIGTQVWRSERWLGEARPLFTSPAVIRTVLVGLDRLYVRTQANTYLAFDPKTGARVGLGPLPPSPFVGDLAAADAWRAVAITDLGGVVATFDAGATWRPLDLRLDPRAVAVAGDAILVSGADAQKREVWYEVREGAQVTRLPGRPNTTSGEKPQPVPQTAAARIFGPRPIAAAVEDGWPLKDGTAVVARDGAIARVRLSDGALVEAQTGAYPLKPSRCHPVPFAFAPRGGAPSPTAFGFVCGEPRGKTILYAYDPAQGQMIEAKRFDGPRAITAAGNGALATRGGCAEQGPSSDGDRTQQTYCLYSRDGAWREIRVRGGDLGGERVIVLDGGKVAVLSPPHGDLTAARITVLDKNKATTLPITFPPLPADVARVLRHGVWLDGVEERRPGVLGIWVEAAGSVLGLEVTLAGQAKFGKYVREAGSPMVSGRYGLGWTGARRGYETTDGGMTWTDIDLPEPIALPKTIKSRACGPVGCSAAGWLRIGWGAGATQDRPEVPPPPRTLPWRGPQQLDLDCDPLAGAPPAPKTADSGGKPVIMPPVRFSPYWSPMMSQGLTQLPALYTQAAPTLRPDELGLAVEMQESTERLGRAGVVARFYTWGPKTSEWNRQGKWLARWVWPYGGWTEIKSTALSNAPYDNLEAARRGFGVAPGAYAAWTYATGDDADHVLVIGRRGGGSPLESTLFSMESERAPVEVRTLDGEPVPEIEATVRAAGHWYLASAQRPNELAATVIWVLDGPYLRELTRVRRAGFDTRPSVRLARRADGRAIGMVIDGQPSADRPQTPQRWVLPLDAETGAAGEPEALGPADLSDRALEMCRGEGPGWILDTQLGGGARVRSGGGAVGSLSGALARLRVTKDTACVSHVAGQLELYGRSSDVFVRGAAAKARFDGPTIHAAVFSGREKYPLRCVAK